MMKNLHLIFGYAGALPFWALAGLGYLAESPGGYQVLMLAYGAMILSFLAGVHWAQGLARHYRLQIALSVLPTFFSLILMVLALYAPAYMALYLALIGLMVWDLYIMDRIFLTPSSQRENYMRFRLVLSVIVSLAFFTAAFLAAGYNFL